MIDGVGRPCNGWHPLVSLLASLGSGGRRPADETGRMRWAPAEFVPSVNAADPTRVIDDVVQGDGEAWCKV